MKFKNGDRVIAKHPPDENEMLVGETGVVLSMQGVYGIRLPYYVVFDSPGISKKYHITVFAWWCEEESLDFVSREIILDL